MDAIIMHILGKTFTCSFESTVVS